MKKEGVFCLLQFFGSFSSTISLCMSSYGLAHNIGKPWVWEHYIITSCILCSIIVHSIKDSLLTNPKLLNKDDEEKEKNIISI